MQKHTAKPASGQEAEKNLLAGMHLLPSDGRIADHDRQHPQVNGGLVRRHMSLPYLLLPDHNIALVHFPSSPLWVLSGAPLR